MTRPSRDQELAVIRAVVYASLFEYPLTLSQVVESLEGVPADEARVRSWIDHGPLIRAALETRDGFYFPAGQARLVGVRRRREAESRRMLALHGSTMRMVASLPFVRSVCLSGSLAHLNGTAAADLDLFVVTAPGRVWSVTTTVLALARLLGRRRQLCLNYVVSERRLALEPADWFAANQLMHLQPITGEAVYRRLLDANPFAARFYPNFRGRAIGTARAPRLPAAARSAMEGLLAVTLAPLYERLAAVLYRRHLMKKASSWDSPYQVRLDAECLKLHTHSHRAEIAARFEDAMAACLEGQPVPVAK
jgi:hypothetical protein